MLTSKYVDSASCLKPHQFEWLEHKSLIGCLPLKWNWLFGEYPMNNKAKNLHYTLGGPYFDGYENSEYADDWKSAKIRAFSVSQKILKPAT